MEEKFDELLEKSNFVASFPCSEAAARFALYISKRGYNSRIEKYDGKWQGYFKVTYWKEDSNES